MISKLLMLSLLASSVVRAEAVRPGDFVAQSAFYCPCGFTFYSLEGLANDSTSRFGVSWYFQDLLTAPDGSIYTAGSGVTRFSAAGDVVSESPTPSFYSAGLAMDRSGTLFDVGREGIVIAYGPGWVELDRFQLPVVSHITSADLSPDQCTLAYTDFALHIHRYDVCRHTQLADFEAFVPYYDGASLRFRDNGEIFVAAGTTHRISPEGRRIRLYDGNHVAVAFDSDGQSIWVGPEMEKLDIETGASLATLPRSNVTKLETYGVGRASARATAAVPLLSAPLRALLIVCLGWIAVRASLHAVG